jgi:hypothetical protein
VKKVGQALEDTEGSQAIKMPADKTNGQQSAGSYYLPAFSSCQEHGQRRFDAIVAEKCSDFSGR